MQDKELQLEDTVSADRKERMIYVGPGKSRKISSITSRQNFDNEKFTRNKNKGGDEEGEEDEKEEVKESAVQPSQSDMISQDKKKKSNSPQIEFVTGTEKAGSSSTAIGNAQNMGIKKISEALVEKAIKQVKGDEWDDKNPPFDPDTKVEKEFKKPHNPNRSPMDTVRALAQKAMNKQKGVKEEVETIDEKTSDTSKNKWVLGTKSDPHKTKPRAKHIDDGVPTFVAGFPQGEEEKQKPHDKNATMKSNHKAKWSGAEHEVKKVDEALLPVVKSAFSKLKDKFSSKPATPAPAPAASKPTPTPAPAASKPASPAAKPAVSQGGRKVSSKGYNYSDSARRAHMAKGGTFDGETGKMVKPTKPAAKPSAPVSKPSAPAAKPAAKPTGPTPGKPTIDKDGGYNYHDDDRKAHMAKGGKFDGNTGKMLKHGERDSGDFEGRVKDLLAKRAAEKTKAASAPKPPSDFERKAQAHLAKHAAEKAAAEKTKAASAPKPETKPSTSNNDHDGHDMIKAAVAAQKAGGDPHKAALDHLTKSNPNLARLMAMKKDGKSGVVKEEAEQIDEISLQTMKSAKEKLGNKAYDAHMDDNKYAARHYANRALNMGSKIKQKESKLAKEEVEQIDELSVGALKSYVNKATPEMKSAKAERQSAREGGDLQTADSARRLADKRTAGIKQAKAKLNKEGQEMKTYQEFLDQLLEYTPGPGGVTRVQGRSYGAQYHDPEGDDDADDKAPAAKAADAPKRGRGRPAGSKSGANQKVTTGKSYGGIATHSLHLPNSK